MKTLLLAAILVLPLSGSFLISRSAQASDYMIGADLSFLKQAEDRGTVFKDQGQAKPGLQIFRDHGYNWIRLRLFHTPTGLPNDLDYTIALAKDARQRGLKFLLNYHYSDTWADPGKQTIPKAWQGKSHANLVQAVFEYTRETIIAFRDAGALPDMVQVGNEITPGMLWPDGKLPDHWRFAPGRHQRRRGRRRHQPAPPNHDPH
jgi:arabinogalactan endo-1,4-beta-galactosidase